MQEDEVICHWREVTQVKDCTWQLKKVEVLVAIMSLLSVGAGKRAP